MLGLTAKTTKGISIGTRLWCDDNSGAKVVQVIGVKGYRARLRSYPRAGVGDIVIVSVKKGKPDMRKQVVFAVIVRQKKAYRRPDGMRIKFEDNAAVVLKDDKGNPKGTIFKGPICKEAAARYPGVAKIASIIV